MFDLDDWARRWSPGISPTDGAAVADLYTPDGTLFDVYIDARNKGIEGDRGVCADLPRRDTGRGLYDPQRRPEGDALAAEWTLAGAHTGDVEG